MINKICISLLISLGLVDINLFALIKPLPLIDKEYKIEFKKYQDKDFLYLADNGEKPSGDADNIEDSDDDEKIIDDDDSVYIDDKQGSKESQFFDLNLTNLNVVYWEFLYLNDDGINSFWAIPKYRTRVENRTFPFTSFFDFNFGVGFRISEDEVEFEEDQGSFLASGQVNYLAAYSLGNFFPYFGLSLSYTQQFGGDFDNFPPFPGVIIGFETHLGKRYFLGTSLLVDNVGDLLINFQIGM